MNARVWIVVIVSLFAGASAAAQADAPTEVFIVPNFHPAS